MDCCSWFFGWLTSDGFQLSLHLLLQEALPDSHCSLASRPSLCPPGSGTRCQNRLGAGLPAEASSSVTGSQFPLCPQGRTQSLVSGTNITDACGQNGPWPVPLSAVRMSWPPFPATISCLFSPSRLCGAAAVTTPVRARPVTPSGLLGGPTRHGPEGGLPGRDEAICMELSATSHEPGPGLSCSVQLGKRTLTDGCHRKQTMTFTIWGNVSWLTAER